MDAALSAEIEGFLYAERRWVSAQELCQRFGIEDDRAFRRCKGRPGLCSEFAISGDAGFRHICHATPGEWEHFAGRMRDHSIEQLVRIKRLRDRRARFTHEIPPVVVEKITGQQLMPSLTS